MNTVGFVLPRRRRRSLRQRARPAIVSTGPDASEPVALTEGDKRYGGVFFSGGRILAVEEDRNTHRLVAIELADGKRQMLAEGADFYSSPIVSADGRRTALDRMAAPASAVDQHPFDVCDETGRRQLDRCAVHRR